MNHFKLTKIDPFTINQGKHAYLELADECYYLCEYVPGGSYQEYASNDYIKNFQINPKHTNRLQYKKRAIKFFAENLVSVLTKDWLKNNTYIPIPPSRRKDDPEYDDRVTQLLNEMQSIISEPLDIRELIIQSQTVQSKQKGLSPTQRGLLYVLDQELVFPKPSQLIIIDDVLTTGCHFKAVQKILSDTFPDTNIIGIFLARSRH